VSFSDVRTGFPGPGNFDADPRIVDWLGGDRRLRIDSPCVDAGTDEGVEPPPVDIEGDPRVAPGLLGSDARVDVGADEMTAPVAVRYGTVNAGVDRDACVVDTLFVNASGGSS